MRRRGLHPLSQFVTAAGLWEFSGVEGMGRGGRRGPWGVKPQGPVNGYFILF